MAKRKFNRRKTDRKPVKRPRTSAGFKGFLSFNTKQLQRYLMTGLMVWVPLIVTIWVSWLVISKVGFGIERFIENSIEFVHSLAKNKQGELIPRLSFLTIVEYRPGLGFLFLAILFFTTGFLTRYLAWRKVLAWGETIVGMIPGINRVYVAAQQIRDVFVRREGTVFQEVVLVEYPRKGLMVVGFVTSREQGVVQRTLGTEMVAIFVPTTPNPTSGFLLYVPPNELTKLKITVEDAMKLIISGGAYLPGHPDIEDLIENN